MSTGIDRLRVPWYFFLEAMNYNLFLLAIKWPESIHRTQVITPYIHPGEHVYKRSDERPERSTWQRSAIDRGTIMADYRQFLFYLTCTKAQRQRLTSVQAHQANKACVSDSLIMWKPSHLHKTICTILLWFWTAYSSLHCSTKRAWLSVLKGKKILKSRAIIHIYMVFTLAFKPHYSRQSE